MRAPLYPHRWRFWCAYQRARRASTPDIVPFCTSTVRFLRTGWGGGGRVPASLTPSGDAFGIHVSVSARRAKHFFLLISARLIITDWVGVKKKGCQRLYIISDGTTGGRANGFLGGGKGKGMPASIYSQRRRFWHACQWIARASAQDIFIF